MSRSNLSLARTLREREEESLMTRKRILKASGLNNCLDVVKQVGNDAEVDYEEKMARLLKFKKSSKMATKRQTSKLVWVDEQKKLQLQCHGLEQDISIDLERFVMTFIGEHIIAEVLEESSAQFSSRKENQVCVMEQVF